MNRRSTLKLISALPLMAAFPVAALAQADKKAAPPAKDKAAAPTAKAPANLMDENDTLAKAMQYKHDASKASPMRTDKKAFCYNCSKYNVCMAGDTSCKPLDAQALKTAEYAPCQIFNGKVVAKNGWCLSWQAKA